MPAAEELHVAVTPDLMGELRAAVDDGAYDSVEDVVREALHDWRVRRRAETRGHDELRRLVQEGIDSGPGKDATEVFAALRARLGQTSPV